jgi:hypothetical protein
MTKAIQRITLSPSRDIPFNKVVLSQSTVRFVNAGVLIEQLAESIARRTLLQSLNVRAVLMEGGTVLRLDEGLKIRRVRVMGAHRIELPGFTDAMCNRLKAYGLFHGIISWKLRMFVPTGAAGVDVPAKVLQRFRIACVGEQEAA